MIPGAVNTAVEAYRCIEPHGSVEEYARDTAFVRVLRARGCRKC